jgi:hypothetical protein
MERFPANTVTLMLFFLCRALFIVVLFWITLHPVVLSKLYSFLGESLVLQPSIRSQRGYEELTFGLQQAHTIFKSPLSAPVALRYDILSALCLWFLGLNTCSNGHYD